jgi:AGZA family xanthine/uracil permease-like MFS transporter
MITIPLTFSIANGLAFGLTSYTIIKLLRGRFREFTWMEVVLASLFIARFVYLAKG